MLSPFGQKFSKTETPLWHSHTTCTFSPSPSLNPGLRLANSRFGNVISASLDSASINPVKIIIINFSLLKYKTKVIYSICHFVTELLNSRSQVFYHHEWLKFFQIPWRYLTCMRRGLVLEIHLVINKKNQLHRKQNLLISQNKVQYFFLCFYLSLNN